MRHTGNKKLRGQRGASLLIALLFTLVGAMVAIVIIDAASTAVKRMYDDTQREQEYLTLESAARLLKAELEDMNPAYRIVIEKADEASGEPDKIECVPGVGAIAPTLYRAIHDAIVANSTEEARLTLHAEITDPADDVEEAFSFQDAVVEMEITSEPDEGRPGILSLKATIRLKDSGAQKLYLTAKSSLAEEQGYRFGDVKLQTRLNDGVSGGDGA